jgi:hypothetical protein
MHIWNTLQIITLYSSPPRHISIVFYRLYKTTLNPIKNHMYKFWKICLAELTQYYWGAFWLRNLSEDMEEARYMPDTSMGDA